jgi:membrane protein implicated in regulation of membrane protease activity
MSSPSLDLGDGPRASTRPVRALLDGMFGLFVWAAHLLAIYIPTALACQFGLGAASRGARASFVGALVLVTIVAAAVVVLHALRRYRQQRDVPDRRFRMAVTLGCDTVATVAIVWQLLAIALIPLCA